MHTDHIADPHIAAALELLETKGDPEALDFLARATMEAYGEDERNGDLEPRELDRRFGFILTLSQNLGDGEEGDAIAARAILRYWSPA